MRAPSTVLHNITKES